MPGFNWALDPHRVQQLPENNFFVDKCLLICTIFGLCQHLYFSSERKDNTFLYLQNIKSNIRKKFIHATNILKGELDHLLTVTKLQAIGPYELQATCKILHETYKCQFFIFTNATSKQKLNFMFPEKYDDALIPIYLYQSYSDLNHLVFIKNLTSYFKANILVCFECKKSFKTYNYRHLCSKRPTCFVCRRFYSSENTYLHEKLKANFCDTLIVKENAVTCPICNCTVFSSHCMKGHKTFCNGVGHFGYKCELKCKRFIYSSKELTSQKIRETHSCSDLTTCNFCFQIKENNHLCKLKEAKISKFHSKLGFIVLETFNEEPLFSLMYLEQTKRGEFRKFLIADPSSNFACNDETFQFDYFLPNTKNLAKTFAQTRNAKITKDFQTILEGLKQSTFYQFSKTFITFLLSSPYTTFICQDKDGQTMVSISVYSLKVTKFQVFEVCEHCSFCLFDH